MSITFKDATTDPLLVPSGQSLNAYKGVAVTDTAPLSRTRNCYDCPVTGLVHQWSSWFKL